MWGNKFEVVQPAKIFTLIFKCVFRKCKLVFAFIVIVYNTEENLKKKKTGFNAQMLKTI